MTHPGSTQNWVLLLSFLRRLDRHFLGKYSVPGIAGGTGEEAMDKLGKACLFSWSSYQQGTLSLSNCDREDDRQWHVSSSEQRQLERLGNTAPGKRCLHND